MRMIVSTDGFDAKHARRMANSYAGMEGYFSDLARRHHAGRISSQYHQEKMLSARERADHWNERADHLERFTRHGRRFIKGTPGLTEYITADGLAINGIAFNELLEDTRRRIHARIDVRRSNADKLAMHNEIPYRFFNAIKMGSMWVDHVNRVMGPAGPGDGNKRKRMYQSGISVVGERGQEVILPKGTPVVSHREQMQRYFDILNVDLYQPVNPGITAAAERVWNKIQADIAIEKDRMAIHDHVQKFVNQERGISNIFEYIATGLRTIWPKHK